MTLETITHTMKPTRHLFGFALVAALIAACGNPSSDDKKAELEKLKAEQAELTSKIKQLEKEIAQATPDSAAVKSKLVSLAEVDTRAFNHYVKTQGLVESEQNIQVSAKSPGVVTQVFVTEGQQVSKGQTLAQQDNSLIERSIDEVNASLELANTVFQRQQNLWEQKIGTEVQYLQAKNNKESLEKRLAFLREQNEQAKIKSPINGVVDEVYLKVGENIAPGQPAVRVINSSELKITANVSEAFIGDINKGNKVLVNIPDLREEFEARVSFVGRNIDPLSRSFTVEIAVPSRPELRPNMTAIVKIVYETYPDAVTVPVNVVQTVNNEKIVFVVEQKGNQMVARKRVVQINGVFDERAQVEGLKPGEKVVTTGYQGLSDGQFIKVG